MPSIEKAPEYLKAIQDIQPLLSETIQTPVGFFITLALSFWFILTRDYNNIFNLLERKTNKKIEHLDKYLSTPALADPASFEVAKEQRDAYYFKISTNGIYAEKQLRSALITLHESSSSTITWKIIRRAMPFLDISDEGSLFVKDKNWNDRIGFFYNRLISSLLVLAAITLFLIHIIFVDIVIIETLKMLSNVVLCICLSLFMFAQNFPRIAADKIETELVNIKPSDVI